MAQKFRKGKFRSHLGSSHKNWLGNEIKVSFYFG
jgi:hypothetical protein